MTSSGTETFFGKPRAVTRGELTPTEQVLCPLCGISPTPFATDYQGFTLCRCGRCGLEFVSPRLSFEELAEKVYSDNYFPKRDQSAAPSAASIHYYSRQLSDLETLLGTRKTVLDVGCGDGSFLEYARGAGWEIAGADIKLAPNARSVDCRLWEGRLQQIEFGESRFDLVRLNHVLEHTPDPLQELKICRGLLNPDGVLFISVPNIAGISPQLKSVQSRLGLKSHRWRHYAAMHHLFFFTPVTLKALVEKAGFRLLKWDTPVQKKEGQNAVLEVIYRTLLERTRSSSILDFYCMPN